MYSVEITNSQSCLDLDEAFLREVVSQTFTAEGVVSAEIGLLIVDNAEMRELNRKHLAHDFDTDVLTFPIDCTVVTENDDANGSSPRGAGKHIEGEIVVSAEMAINQAVNFGWRPVDELTLYIVHGLLHLTGYDDIDDAECVLMRQREREILAHWNLVPADADT